MHFSRQPSGSCTLLITLKIKNGILLAFDSRSHDKKKNKAALKDCRLVPVFSKAWDIANQRKVEKVNEKVQLAQYCALAIAGSSKIGFWVHNQLLEEVLTRLEHEKGQEKQLTADDAVRLIRDNLEKKILEAKTPEEKTKITKRVKNTLLIYATWEKDIDDTLVAKIMPIEYGGTSDDVDYQCFGIQQEAATHILEREWKPGMSLTEGTDLISRVMKEAFISEEIEKKGQHFLGGRLKICVLQPRDTSELPLGRNEEAQDRAITFLDLGSDVFENASNVPRRQSNTGSSELDVPRENALRRRTRRRPGVPQYV
ncbi:hypothetical protein MKW94_012452 [Papaver nudicaule]|uniref:Uncharacterized protein n=1 Tax=Papaver nudicaule TaxID=74823 RepID=A0AA41VT60_PAPNU|nr:hypothetical protein [Papaver nudicaule]